MLRNYWKYSQYIRKGYLRDKSEGDLLLEENEEQIQKWKKEEHKQEKVWRMMMKMNSPTWPDKKTLNSSHWSS